MLRKYIPNVITTVKGEIPLFDKLVPFLQNAEFVRSVQADGGGWCDDGCYSFVGCGADSERVRYCQQQQHRSGLIDSIETIRDNAIEALLPFLMKREDWRDTEQGHFFQGTLFPNIDLTTLCGYSSHRWKQYLGLRHRTQQFEEQLAAEYISSEQLDVLHEMNLKGSASTIQKRIIDKLRQIIVALLTDNNAYATTHTPHSALPDIVQMMRSHPEEFPQWHSSHVAKLFSPPIFVNKKENKGYWF